MYNQYYIVYYQGEIIYFSVISMNEAHQISLYKGRTLLRQRSIDYGDPQLIVAIDEDIKLKISFKWLKIVPELRINGEIVNHEKLKRKELRKVLVKHEITNEINPKVKPKEPFKLSNHKIELIFILIGSVLMIFADMRENNLSLIHI